MKLSQIKSQQAPGTYRPPLAGETASTGDRVWSPQQENMFLWFARKPCFGAMGFPNAPHLIGRARAGTGKTTTIIEGVNRAPEQNILVCAFNKQTEQALNQRISNPRARSKTIHALGYAAIRSEWSGMPVAQGDARAEQLTSIGCPPLMLDGQKVAVPKPIRFLVTKLHTKIREITPLDLNVQRITDLAYQFDCEPEEAWRDYDMAYVVKAAIVAVQHAATEPPSYDIGIDYADMIALPLQWNLLVKEYDLVVVDEAQDLTMAQLEIAQRVCSGRLCLVGDDRQAIYLWRGAALDAIDLMKEHLQAAELPLSVTYRCAKAIVREAQKLVPDITCGDTMPEGIVDGCHYDDLIEDVRPGDFVLCRLNAPLVSLTLRLIANGVRARMVGRDIGAGIRTILRRLKLQPWMPVSTLRDSLEAWRRKTVTHYASVGQLALVDRTNDQADTIYSLAAYASTVGDIEKRCLSLFDDNLDPSQYVICSSIHRAKGLEAERVFAMTESLYRRGPSTEEDNLSYVMTTRAKRHLTKVVGVPSLQRRS